MINSQSRVLIKVCIMVHQGCIRCITTCATIEGSMMTPQLTIFKTSLSLISEASDISIHHQVCIRCQLLTLLVAGCMDEGVVDF
jgi:hypothetical protein